MVIHNEEVKILIIKVHNYLTTEEVPGNSGSPIGSAEGAATGSDSAGGAATSSASVGSSAKRRDRRTTIN